MEEKYGRSAASVAAVRAGGAANALSDVFAMGGRVLFALSIAAFPEELPRHLLGAVLDVAGLTWLFIVAALLVLATVPLLPALVAPLRAATAPLATQGS